MHHQKGLGRFVIKLAIFGIFFFCARFTYHSVLNVRDNRHISCGQSDNGYKYAPSVFSPSSVALGHKSVNPTRGGVKNGRFLITATLDQLNGYPYKYNVQLLWWIHEIYREVQRQIEAIGRPTYKEIAFLIQLPDYNEMKAALSQCEADGHMVEDHSA